MSYPRVSRTGGGGVPPVKGGCKIGHQAAGSVTGGPDLFIFYSLWLGRERVPEPLLDPALTQPAKIRVPEPVSPLHAAKPSVVTHSAVRDPPRAVAATRQWRMPPSGGWLLCALSIFGIVVLIACELISRSQLSLGSSASDSSSAPPGTRTTTTSARGHSSTAR